MKILKNSFFQKVGFGATHQERNFAKMAVGQICEISGTGPSSICWLSPASLPRFSPVFSKRPKTTFLDFLNLIFA